MDQSVLMGTSVKFGKVWNSKFGVGLRQYYLFGGAVGNAPGYGCILYITAVRLYYSCHKTAYNIDEHYSKIYLRMILLKFLRITYLK